MDDISIQQLLDSLADLREQILALHHTPTQDNLTRRQGQDVIHQSRCDVLCFDIPIRVRLRDVCSLYPKPFLNGGSVREPLETISMEGTIPFKRVTLNVVRDAQMSHLQVEHSDQR